MSSKEFYPQKACVLLLIRLLKVKKTAMQPMETTALYIFYGFYLLEETVYLDRNFLITWKSSAVISFWSVKLSRISILCSLLSPRVKKFLPGQFLKEERQNFTPSMALQNSSPFVCEVLLVLPNFPSIFGFVVKRAKSRFGCHDIGSFRKINTCLTSLCLQYGMLRWERFTYLGLSSSHV